MFSVCRRRSQFGWRRPAQQGVEDGGAELWGEGSLEAPRMTGMIVLRATVNIMTFADTTECTLQYE